MTTHAAPRRGNLATRQAIASRWPLLMGALGLGAGIILAVISALSASIHPFSGDVAVLVAEVDTLPLSIGGYILTPFVVIGALIWDRIAQRSGLRDRNFAPMPRYSSALQLMSIAAMVIALWHIYNIAYTVATS